MFQGPDLPPGSHGQCWLLTLTSGTSLPSFLVPRLEVSKTDVKGLEHAVVMGQLAVGVTFLSLMCSPGVKTTIPPRAYTNPLPGSPSPCAFLGPSHVPGSGQNLERTWNTRVRTWVRLVRCPGP